MKSLLVLEYTTPRPRSWQFLLSALQGAEATRLVSTPMSDVIWIHNDDPSLFAHVLPFLQRDLRDALNHAYWFECSEAYQPSAESPERVDHLPSPEEVQQ
jgi:hypothetical protein